MEIDQSLGLRRESLVDRLALAIAVTFFLVTVVLVTVQVVLRLIDLSVTLAWTEPAARLALVIGTYFGAAVASRNNEHISMDIVLRKLEEKYPRVKAVFDLLVRFIVIITLSIVVFGLLQGAQSSWNSNWADIDAVNIGMVYLAIGLGLTWMLGYELFKLKELLSTVSFDRKTPLEVIQNDK
ncbi:TRAP transporter small permease [Natrinema versiforme]|uniref:TRAP transporter small permease n=1 Tax=Natrinema versiforme TaxID=88724 RepID=A0A4V1G0D3_9EURY|nr:TRAP transporter small permease [Natrinema versiforme]QCS44946.1 TRAP transporter small permease [Natrinema versiforme]